MKRNRKWQQQGFRSYAEYKQHIQKTSMANTAKATVADMFQECLQEAVHCKADEQRRHQEAADRLRYHQLRLQELNKFPVVSE